MFGCLPHAAAAVRRILRSGGVAAFAAAIVVGAPPPSLARDTGVVNGRGLLWRIERPATKVAASHLFGTIHVTDDRVLDLPVPVLQAFHRSRRAVFEVVMDSRLQAAMARAVLLPPGRLLSDVIGRERWMRTQQATAQYMIPADTVAALKPWAVAAILAVPRGELARTAAGLLPLDKWLQEEARRLGKPVGALETVDEQIEVFDGMGQPDQVAFLDSALNDSPEIDRLFDVLTARYLDRDISGIHELMVQRSVRDPRAYEKFMERFVIARNKLMARRMSRHIDKGGAFVAVGALHLPGKAGIIALLRAGGYQVRRVY